MNVLLIGFGQAGGLIVEEFLRYERATDRSFVGGTLAVDTSKTDLMELEHVPEANRVLIGQSHVKGHGVGADNELGAEIAEDDISEIQAGLDRFSMHELDAFVIVAGLGGGTGSGGAPVLAKHLQKLYVEPVYGLGVLPATDEGGIYTLNAARSLSSFVEAVDNLLVFDNDAWTETGNATDHGTANEELVRRVASVLSVPDDARDETVSPADVIETLETGGVTSIGFAAEDVERPSSGLLSSLTGGSDTDISDAEKIDRITSQVRKSALGKLSLPAEIGSADGALLSVSGPEAHLNHDGVERGRQWLVEQADTDRVRAGIDPVDADHVAATVVLSGLRTVPRFDDLEQVTREAERRTETTESAASDAESGSNTGEPDASGDPASEPMPEPPADTAPDDARATEEADSAGKRERAAATGADSARAGSRSEPTPSDAAPSESISPEAADRIPSEIPTTPAMNLRYGDIEIGDRIGGGGNADVHEARAPGGERLAVKLPRFEGTLHTDEIERVLAEAETWSKLDDHDHIVDVVDYGETPRPWIAMEHMDGGTLADRINELDLEEAAWIATRVAAAIEHAHRHGVAHLDLKPENVLFRSTPGDHFDVPKVADWGLSKHLLEHTGSVDGLSTQYAAPEQFDSDLYGDSSDRTDIYQLGVIVHELFTGHPPFEGSTASVMNSILNDDPKPPTERDPSLPEAVDEMLLKALEPDQDDRHDHVVLFRRALEDLAPDDAA